MGVCLFVDSCVSAEHVSEEGDGSEDEYVEPEEREDGANDSYEQPDEPCFYDVEHLGYG